MRIFTEKRSGKLHGAARLSTGEEDEEIVRSGKGISGVLLCRVDHRAEREYAKKITKRDKHEDRFERERVH